MNNYNTNYLGQARSQDCQNEEADRSSASDSLPPLRSRPLKSS